MIGIKIMYQKELEIPHLLCRDSIFIYKETLISGIFLVESIFFAKFHNTRRKVGNREEERQK